MKYEIPPLTRVTLKNVVAIALGFAVLVVLASRIDTSKIAFLPFSQLASVEGTGSGLTGWWTFDSSSVSGATVYDISDNGNDVTLTNNPSVITGKIGNGISLTQNDQRITAPSAASGFPLTYCGWFNRQGSGNQRLFNSNALVIDSNDDGLQYDVGAYNNRTTVSAAYGSLHSNVWEHLCVTVESNYTTKIYVNGVALATSGSFSEAFGGGQLSIAPGFTGYVDDVRTYNRALSATEVLNVYNQGGTGGPTDTYTLTVSRTGSGTVTSSPSGITCPSTCSKSSIIVGSQVTLTAVPATGYSTTWSGCGATTGGNTCALYVNGDTTVTTGFITTPPAPVISSVATSSRGLAKASEIKVTWTTNVVGDSQVAYGTDTSYGSQTTLDSRATTTHSVTITGLTPGTTYHFKAKSSNAYGQLGESADYVFTTAALGPEKPTHMLGQGVTPDQINIVWAQSNTNTVGATTTKYYVYRDGVRIATIVNDSYLYQYSFYQDIGLAANTSHTYYVVAEDSAGNLSPHSDSITLRTLASSVGSGIIPDERLVDWTPGVMTGVPGGVERFISGANARTHLIDITQAPYNAKNDDSADAQPAILQAIADAQPNDVIYFPAGTYRINGTIAAYDNTLKSNITLRGAGMDSTIIDCRVNDCVWIGSSSDYSWNYPSTGNTVASGKSKGSNQLTIQDTSNFTVGQMVKVAATDDRPDLSDPNVRPIVSVYGFTNNRGQLSRVTGISGNTLTIYPPLYADYTDVPVHVYRAARQVDYFGIEDMTFDGGNGNTTAVIQFEQTYASWIKNVRIVNTGKRGIYFADTLNNEIRHTFVDRQKPTADHGSGLLIDNTWGALIEDNIIYKNYPSIEVNHGAGGNVFAYNFVFDSRVYCPDCLEGQGINSNHSPHNNFNLYEGNISPNMQSDGYFGGESDGTFFRNWLHGLEPATNYLTFNGPGAYEQQSGWIISLNRWTRNYSLVGNVLGANGHTTRGYSAIGLQGNPNIGNSDTAAYAPPWTDPYNDAFRYGSGTITQDGYDITTTDNLFVPSDAGTRNTGRTLWVPTGSAVHGGPIERYISPNHIVLNSDLGIVTPTQSAVSASEYGVFPGTNGWQEGDLGVRQSLIARANFDYYFDRIPADEGLNGKTLPRSMYLGNTADSKPAWFGDLTWPPFDPTNPDAADDNDIPAGYRFNHNGADPPGVSSGTTYALSVQKNGTGSGTVTSAGGSINCGSSCSVAGVANGTSVVLTATAASGSTFTGWNGGGCSGTGTCTVTTGSVVTATFNSNSVVDTDPPFIYGQLPAGSQPPSTTSALLELATDENATCKYGTTAGVAYASIANTFTTTGSRVHSATVSGLTPNTSYTYYVRCSDAVSNVNLTDSAISFTVLPIQIDGGGATPAAPTVTTTLSPTVTATTATLGGTITATGTQAVTSRGFEYGASSYSSTSTETGSWTTTGAYTRDITGLTCNTTYVYRAYAHNSVGTSYGANQSFTTSACPSSGGTTSGGTVSTGGSSGGTRSGGGGGGTTPPANPATTTPVIGIKADPSTIAPGGASTITWDTKSTSYCYAPWTTSTAVKGTQVVKPTVTTTYTLTCFSADKKTFKQLPITVNVTGKTLTSSAVTTTSATCTTLTRVMSLGSQDTKTNTNVAKLQKFLNSQGYTKFKPTGYFGTLTRAAVVDFQKKNKLPSTGIAGAMTAAKVKAISCK